MALKNSSLGTVIGVGGHYIARLSAVWLPSPLHTRFVNMTQLHKLAARHQQRLPLPYISLAVVFSGIRELYFTVTVSNWIVRRDRCCRYYECIFISLPLQSKCCGDFIVIVHNVDFRGIVFCWYDCHYFILI